jgi:SagB-type dehydrogenase family enzyme
MPELSPSIAQHYHERTKYHPETIANKSKPLDWSNQPIPFKEYKIGNNYDLKPYLSASSSEADNADALLWGRLSRLLGCSYGLTAKVPTMGTPLYLRSAPSAGGLYPAELYLISRGTPLLPPGLYNYQPTTHSLLHFWQNEVWEGLQKGCFWHPALETTQLALVTTAVFYRSAWRYEDRAYRRILLDTGHLLGNIELAGAINAFRPYLIGGFQDRVLNDLLYLDASQEAVFNVIPLADLLDIQQHLSRGKTTLASQIVRDYPILADGELLNYLHTCTEITSPDTPEIPPAPQETSADKYNFPFCLKVATSTHPIDWKAKLSGLETTILKRRSTRSYSGGELTLEELKAVLHFTYHPEDYADQELDPQPDYFDLDLLETFLAISGVTGLEEGCYYYAPKAQELRQIRFKNFQKELHYLCLGQELGRDAGAVIFQTADLKKAVAKYGDRAYRYLHIDAGHLGQRLNLAAIYLDLGVSGIGGYFDDQVNEVLGIPTDEAVIYITTLGRPKQSSR